MKKVVLAVVFGLLMAGYAEAQQGKYVNSASARLVKLVDQANKDGYKLQNDGFSIGGGWLKQGTNNWVPLFTTTLTAGKEYRIVAAGDMDAKDVDVEIRDESGRVVASDTLAYPEAIVNFRPGSTGRYTVRLRLFASDGNAPAVCLAILLSK